MIQDGINAGIIWVKCAYYERDERFIFYADFFSDSVSMKINGAGCQIHLFCNLLL
jgi:hypothetical protein